MCGSYVTLSGFSQVSSDYLKQVVGFSLFPMRDVIVPGSSYITIGGQDVHKCASDI